MGNLSLSSAFSTVYNIVVWGTILRAHAVAI